MWVNEYIVPIWLVLLIIVPITVKLTGKWPAYYSREWQDQPKIKKDVPIVKQIWRGDIGLFRTFWLVYLLGNGLIIGAMKLFEKSADVNTVGSIAANVYFVAYLASLVYTFFCWVSVWRAARKYRNDAISPVLARSVVIWAALSSAFQYYNAVVPQFWAEVDQQLTAKAFADIETMQKTLPQKVDERSTWLYAEALPEDGKIRYRYGYLVDPPLAPDEMAQRRSDIIAFACEEILDRVVTAFTVSFYDKDDYLFNAITVRSHQCE